MARRKATMILPGQLEVEAQGALDAREVVDIKADLLDAESFPYAYEGLQVYVREEKKRYTLIADDTTQESSWREDGSGGGSGGSVDLSEYAKLTDIPTVPTDISAFNNDSGYQNATDVNSAIDTKLQGYQPAITIDPALSDTSENPVQNKVVKAAIDAITATTGEYDYLFSWNASTHTLYLNEGTDDEQALKLLGIPYNSDIPDVSVFAKSEDLATVATSGNFEDLTNKPTPYDDTALVARVEALEDSSASVDLSDYYTKEETDNLISNINGLDLVPVATLPTQDIRTDCIYLVNDSLVSNNIYTEYVYLNNEWERIGSATIDMSGYYTKDEVDDLVANAGSGTPVPDAEVNSMIEEVFGISGGGGGNDLGYDPDEP